MSAFLESGRSNTRKTAETKVRFRPRLCEKTKLQKLVVITLYNLLEAQTKWASKYWLRQMVCQSGALSHWHQNRARFHTASAESGP